MNPTERFTGRAGHYVTGRPSYPAASVDALFDGLGDPAALTVVDLGAGTGISSRLLADRGASVLAVEPNVAMRAAAASHANVQWVDGTAERTTLAEGIADLVTAFQAFHWFDHPEALREMLRILRAGGRAAVVYNERDEDDPFTAAFGEIVRRYQTDETELRRVEGREIFVSYPAWHHVRRLAIPNPVELDRAKLHARANSSSYLPQSGQAADDLHECLDALFDSYARADGVTMHMQTLVFLADSGADGA